MSEVLPYLREYLLNYPEMGEWLPYKSIIIVSAVLILIIKYQSLFVSVSSLLLNYWLFLLYSYLFHRSIRYNLLISSNTAVAFHFFTVLLLFEGLKLFRLIDSFFDYNFLWKLKLHNCSEATLQTHSHMQTHVRHYPSITPIMRTRMQNGERWYAQVQIQ